MLNKLLLQKMLFKKELWIPVQHQILVLKVLSLIQLHWVLKVHNLALLLLKTLICWLVVRWWSKICLCFCLWGLSRHHILFLWLLHELIKGIMHFVLSWIMVPMIHIYRLLEILDWWLLLSAFLVKGSLGCIDGRLKFFFLDFIIWLLVELHEVRVDRQILKSNNHLRLFTKVVLLLLVGQIHAWHIVELVDVIRVMVVWVMFNTTMEAWNVKALLRWNTSLNFLCILSNMTLSALTFHFIVKALLLILVLARLKFMIRGPRRLVFVRSASICEFVRKDTFWNLIFIFIKDVTYHFVYNTRRALLWDLPGFCNDANLGLQVY